MQYFDWGNVMGKVQVIMPFGHTDEIVLCGA
jgi:hypothetical protein